MILSGKRSSIYFGFFWGEYKPVAAKIWPKKIVAKMIVISFRDILIRVSSVRVLYISEIFEHCFEYFDIDDKISALVLEKLFYLLSEYLFKTKVFLKTRL